MSLYIKIGQVIKYAYFIGRIIRPFFKIWHDSLIFNFLLKRLTQCKY